MEHVVSEYGPPDTRVPQTPCRKSGTEYTGGGVPVLAAPAI